MAPRFHRKAGGFRKGRGSGDPGSGNRHSPRDHSAKVIRAESLCQCRSREGEALGSTAPPDCTHDVAGMVKPLQEIRLLAPGQG